MSKAITALALLAGVCAYAGDYKIKVSVDGMT
jgi:hypothetical protein